MFISDQRLTASKVSTQENLAPIAFGAVVINALRHQRLVHTPTANSTLNNALLSDQRLTASKVSTPPGKARLTSALT